MRTIHKQRLDQERQVQTIKVSEHAKLLTVKMQYGEPSVWYETDSEAPQESPRRIVHFGTGHPMPEIALRYLATTKEYNDRLVFHWYEVEEF